VYDYPQAEEQKARRAVGRRLDAAKDAEELLRESGHRSPEPVGTGGPATAAAAASKGRLSVREAERCLAVLDILRGAIDPTSVDPKDPRWLDASFCHRLPPRAEFPAFYADAQHPVDLASVEKKTRQRAFGSVREFCAECEWVFVNAEAFAFAAEEATTAAAAAATAAVTAIAAAAADDDVADMTDAKMETEMAALAAAPSATYISGAVMAADATALRKIFRRKALVAFAPLAVAAAARGGAAGTKDKGKGAAVAATPSKAAKLAKHPRGRALVGRRLLLYWPEDDVWYAARCVAHAAGRGHKLHYTLDGEEEWIDDLDKGGGGAPAPPPPLKGQGTGGGGGKATVASAAAAHTRWVPESPEMAAPLDVDSARALLRVLEGLQRHADSRGRRLADLFYRLPTPEELPEYYRLIPKPVDLAMIFARLLGGEYVDAGDFV
jgi:hypothetical protein